MELLHAQRVVSSERRGSSWPVLAETEQGLKLVKLRGAAQGTGPLVAEVIVAHLAEALSLKVPRRCVVQLDSPLKPPDGNQELSHLLALSQGENLGFAFLEKAHLLGADEAERVTPDTAAAIVWLDALVMNPDRTARNSNLLWASNQLWLIDHGAALGFQYAWSGVLEGAPLRRAPGLAHHFLRARARDLAEWDEVLAPLLTREVLEAAAAEVPDSFLLPLLPEARRAEPDALPRRRAAYVAYLWKRLKAPRAFWVP